MHHAYVLSVYGVGNAGCWPIHALYEFSAGRQFFSADDSSLMSYWLWLHQLFLADDVRMRFGQDSMPISWSLHCGYPWNVRIFDGASHHRFNVSTNRHRQLWSARVFCHGTERGNFTRYLGCSARDQAPDHRPLFSRGYRRGSMVAQSRRTVNNGDYYRNRRTFFDGIGFRWREAFCRTRRCVYTC